MSVDLCDLVNRYSIKYDHKIRSICEPLEVHLGIPNFSYYSIEEDGRFVILSNFPEQVEFFCANEMYHSCPYLAHPSLFRSGAALIPVTYDPMQVQQSRKQYGIDHLMLILNCTANKVEGFMFTTKDLNVQTCQNFIPKFDLLNKFGGYFKIEAQELINRALSERYNIKSVRGKAFTAHDPNLILSRFDKTTVSFLRQTSLLSWQEQRCLELYRQGHSAQSTAAVLGLSQRTVEHYLDHIKEKLNCRSKRELLTKG